MKKTVIAKNKSIAAGRDIHIRVILGDDGPDIKKTLGQLGEALGLNHEQLMQALNLSGHEHLASEQIFEALNRLILEKSLSDTSSAEKYSTLAAAAANVAAQAVWLQSELARVQLALEKKDYGNAYQLLKGLVFDERCPKTVASEIMNDCLQCGFLHFANQGKTADFDELFSLAETAHISDESYDTLYLVAEMQQEHATRQLSTIGLKENLHRVRSLLETAEDNREAFAYLKILEGLCLRRLGERGDEKPLREAEEVLASLSKIEHGRPIEALNNLAITQIRLFSIAGEMDALNRAQTTLQDVPALAKDAALSEYQAFPKYLNNYGNYFKQRLRQSGSYSDYSAAIEKYTSAEKYWNEVDAPYEWAMLQKNKADVREIFLSLQENPDSSLLRLAYDEVVLSTRYRTEEDAPRQYSRSMAVMDRITELAKQHDVRLGHVDKRRSQRRMDVMSMKPRKLSAVLS